MADIATLGIAVKSDQVEKGAASLDRLSASAKRAEAATSGVAGASKATSAANAAVSTSANSAAVALNRETVAANKTSAALVAANSNARRMTGSFSGLGAQFQDIGVTAAMGMNPLIIGLQQGSQMAGQLEVSMQGGQSAVGALGSAFRSLLSPVTFITIGLTALAALGLQMVDWAGVAAFALNGLAWAIDNLTPYILAASATLALLYAPAIISGLAAVTVAIGTMSVAALRAAASFTAAWLAALGPAGWFILGLAAVVAAAVVFRDEIAKIFGVDIVGAAKDAVNSIIGFFVGGFNGIVAAGSSLPAAFGDLAYQIADKFQAGISAMIRSTIASINGLISTINGKLGGIGVNIPQLGGGLIGLNANGTQSHIKNPYAGVAAGVGDTISSEIAKAQGVDYVGAGIGAISSAASAGAAKLRELAGSFGSVEEAAKKAGKAGKSAADKTKSAWDKAQKAIESAKQTLGEGFGNIINGLLNKTLSWKDALLQAGQALLKYFNQMSLAQGGGGLFGGGIFGGLMKGLLGFASGGYTGRGSASSVAGVVHGGEYVFSKRATDRIGVGALEGLHSRAKGYANGGYVSRSVPRMQAPANDRGNVTIQGSTIVIQGNADQTTVEDIKRLLDERDKKLIKKVPQVVDDRYHARQTRKVRA